MIANTLFSGCLLSTNVSSLCPQPAGSSFPRPLIQSHNSQVPCSWSWSLIFFKKTSSLGNRGARKYLLIGLYMASIPLFSSPYNQSISKPCWLHIPDIPRITSSSLHSNNPVANYYQFLPEKKIFFAWTICNKLPLDPCFSPCLTTAVNTISASLPHFVICYF